MLQFLFREGKQFSFLGKIVSLSNKKKTENKQHPTDTNCCSAVAKIPDWGDIVNSGIGLSNETAKLHWLAGRYDNHMPESTISPCQELYGSRCTQLPLIEKLLQWLSGPSPSLSVAANRPRVTGPDSNDVRTRSIYSTNNVDDINAKAVEA